MSDLKEERMKHVKALLATIPKENANRDGLKGTPDRVARMYDEIFSGYDQSPKDVLGAMFDTDNEEMVIVKDIDYYSQCEHHMVPFFGHVHIGYIPDGKVLGLSKFARLVEIYARRLQIQEQMTFQIAEAIQENLKPKGLIVVVTGKHLCMAMRGVKKLNSSTTTSAVRGLFADKMGVKEEFLTLLNL